MIGRWGVALAILLLTAAAVIDLGLGAALLGDTAVLSRSLGLFAGLTGPGLRLAMAGRAAMADAAVAAAAASVAGLLAACAAARLSRVAGLLLTALIRLPALTIFLAGLLAWVLLLGAWGPVIAALAGLDVATGRLGVRWTMAVLLTPVIALDVGRAAMRLHRAQFEALATLGIGPLRRLLLHALPTVLPAAIRTGVIGFFGAALVLLLRAWPVPARQDIVPLAVAPLDQPALWALAFCAAILLAGLLALFARE